MDIKWLCGGCGPGMKCVESVGMRGNWKIFYICLCVCEHVVIIILSEEP